MRMRGMCVVVAAALSVCAHATDYTDIWWAGKAEDGWGVNLAHSDRFIFATFFVYGPGNVPTWYAGNLTLDGTGAYTGGLYSTSGTYLGTVPYNPAQYSATQVGSASFRPTAAGTGVLTYNVGGVSVTKNIQRQTLTPIPLAGTYTGGVAISDSACADPADNGVYAFPATITVQRPAPGQLRVAIELALGIGTCTVSNAGLVTQTGQLHSFGGVMTCAALGGIGVMTGSVTVSELRATSLGVEGRWSAPNFDGCREEARFSGALTF